MRSRLAVIFLLFAASIAGPSASAGPQSAATRSGFAQCRVAHLRHGINVSEWFVDLHPARARSHLGAALGLGPLTAILLAARNFE